MDKKKRLALDVIGQLEDDLESNPLDYSKWSKLIKQVLVKDKEDQIRTTFDKYLSIFKFDGKQWCNYINFEMGRQDFKKVQELFGKCITTIDNVELFRLYVSYVRRVNDVITGGEKARGIVIQAFEFSVNRVGIDLKSGGLWTDYLDFLKSWTPTASWEHQQKNDLIRKVYKKLLVIPTENIGALWTSYTKWENEINSSTASRFIADRSAEFMEARSWNVEWHNVVKNQLKRELIPLDVTNDSVKIQLSLWYRWLEFEKKNGMNLKDESELKHRIEYVYKQSVMTLPFVPELWYNYSNFLKAKDSNATEILTQSLILNPKSYLLSFELSELYERENNLTKANATLQKLIDALTGDYDTVVAKINSINDRAKSSGTNSSNEIINDNKTNNEDDDEDYMENHQKQQNRLVLSESDINTLKLLTSKQKELSTAITLVYTKLMMTNKRASGIKESRQIFKQAKKFTDIGHELYVENALMEYYSDNKNIARKVFELGMKTYGHVGQYLISYLEFLIMVNEIDNIKVMFETGINNLKSNIDEDTLISEDTDSPSWVKEMLEDRIQENRRYVKKLFKYYSKFATKFLDLGIVSSLESRYKELFPDEDAISYLSARYSYDKIDLIRYDLGKRPRYHDEDEYDHDSNVSHNASSSNNEPESKRTKVSLPSKPAMRVEEQVAPVVDVDPINQPVTHGFIGNSVYSLLKLLPNASYFGNPQDHVFNSKKLVELFNSVDIPN